MPLLRIDATRDVPQAQTGRTLRETLAAHLAPLPSAAPLIIATHGLRHSPFGQGYDPHRGLLSARPGPAPHWKARSLIRRLHMGDGQRLDGHGIAFGWDGSGWLWPAMARARQAGQALARTCETIRILRPDLRIGIVTHSLGARVVIEAMLHADRPIFDRALLLTPADTRGRAARALEAAGGRDCQVIATQTPENWLTSLGFAAAVPGIPTLAFGPKHQRWTDFVPDRRPDLGVRPWAHRTCHWSCYLRPGLWPLYRGWLTGSAGAALFRSVPQSLQASGAETNVGPVTA
ncbi:MAG: hypothetical protein AAF366_00410 [Pseudomonadota bacterium]